MKALKPWRWGLGLPRTQGSQEPQHHPPSCTTWPGACRTRACGPMPGPRLEVVGLTVGGCVLALDIRVGFALEARGNQEKFCLLFIPGQQEHAESEGAWKGPGRRRYLPG